MNEYDRLPPYNLSMLEPGDRIMATGPSGAGKTNQMLNVIHEFSTRQDRKRRIDDWLIFTTTPGAMVQFSTVVPSFMIKRGINMETLYTLGEFAAKAATLYQRINVGIVFDDAETEREWRTREFQDLLYKFVANWRHANITTIIMVKDSIRINPDLRQNLNVVFVFATTNVDEIVKLHKHHAGSVPSAAIFRDYLMQAMRPRMGENKSYRFVVLHEGKIHRGRAQYVLDIKAPPTKREALPFSPLHTSQSAAQWARRNFNPRWQLEKLKEQQDNP